MTVTAATFTIAPTAAASGTNALAASVSVKFVDSVGGQVGPVAATVVGIGWSVAGIDVSALADGVVVVQVTETPSSGPKTFDARTATKQSSTARHETCQAWATHLDVRADYGPATDAEMDLLCWVASDELYLLTGSRWPGVCADKVRPQARWRVSDRPGWWPGGGSRFGWCACNRGKESGCARIPEIELRGPVVESSVTVKVDGVVFTDWKLLDGRWLVRTDGDGWYCCQDMLLDDTEVGTWSVESSYGQLPAAGGTLAAAALGYQLSLAFRADSKCALPRRIQSITRGQTTIALLDPLTLFADGLTGLSEVDLWIASHMVGNRRRPATISSVGRRPRFRRDAPA